MVGGIPRREAVAPLAVLENPVRELPRSMDAPPGWTRREEEELPSDRCEPVGTLGEVASR